MQPRGIEPGSPGWRHGTGTSRAINMIVISGELAPFEVSPPGTGSSPGQKRETSTAPASNGGDGGDGGAQEVAAGVRDQQGSTRAVQEWNMRACVGVRVGRSLPSLRPWR